MIIPNHDRMCPAILRAITMDQIRLRGHNIFLMFFRPLYRRLLMRPKSTRMLTIEIFRVGLWSRDLLRIMPVIINPVTQKISPVMRSCLDMSV